MNSAAVCAHAPVEVLESAWEQQGWPEHFRLIWEEVPRLFIAARSVYEEAVSWRGFRVGAAGLAVRERRECAEDWDSVYISEAEVVSDRNNKPEEHLCTECAEMRMLKEMARKGFNFLPAFVVCGDTDPDPVHGPLIDPFTKKEAITLSSCVNCCRELSRGTFTSSDTIIIEVRPDFTTFAVRSQRALLEVRGFA